MKICLSCNKKLSNKLYYKTKSGALSSSCTECSKKYFKDYYLKNNSKNHILRKDYLELCEKNRKIIKCISCGKPMIVSPSQLKSKYCSVKCYNKLKDKNPNWKGGKREDGHGYIYIYKPEHPRAVSGVVYEHVLKIENKIGRYLFRDEVVHHKNGIKSDNRINNLKLMTRSEHARYHGLNK